MLNKKGFTIAEVVVSFAMITIILTTIVGFTVRYRDRVKGEEIKSQLIDFKNTITKVVYDDIISGKIVRMEKCLIESNCINLIDKNNNAHVLSQEIISVTSGNIKKGIYINYDGTKYMLPDSDINESNEYMCYFDEPFTLNSYENKFYTLVISYKHMNFEESYKIYLTIN